MHGLSVADDIIRQAEKIAKENEGKTITELHVKVGRFAFPNDGELTSAFKFLSKDSPVRKAALKIEYIDGHNCIFDKVVFEEKDDGTRPGEDKAAGD